MLNRLFLLLCMLTALSFFACDEGDEPKPDDNTPTDTKDSSSTCGGLTVLQGTIDTNMTLSSDCDYVLRGYVYIDGGATLTIEPGTVIKGEKTTDGTLVIMRGAKIMAEGTVAQPIVFTSNQPPLERDKGDWGGVIICGKAPINEPGEPQVEGGTGAVFGGNEPEDNSGVFRYVRIEFSGVPLFTNQEINGLTMAGVGRGTQIDHIQVSHSGDDAFEWFGGTVNAKYLVAYRTQDDDFDTDMGHQGLKQFLFAVRDPAIADGSISNGIESDNNAAGTGDSPFTSSTYSNMTLMGPYETQSTVANSLFRNGLGIDKRSRANVFNSVVMGWEYGVRIDGKTTVTPYRNDDARLRHNIIAGWQLGTATQPGAVAASDPPDFTFNPTEWFLTPAFGNDTLFNNADVGLTDPFSLTAPNPMPKAGSIALSGADFSDPILQDPFFEKVSYRGAFGDVNWMEGWTNFDPQRTEY